MSKKNQKEQESGWVEFAKITASVAAAAGAVTLSVLAQEAACKRGEHSYNVFDRCRYCNTRRPERVTVIHTHTHDIGCGHGHAAHTRHVHVSTDGCCHQWAKADSFTVVCLSCGKTLDKYAYDKSEAAMAKALLQRL